MKICRGQRSLRDVGLYANGEPAATNLPSGAAAYSLIPATTPKNDASAADYRIGPLDTIDVTIYQEPDLSAKALQVDAAGRIALPLVGTVDANGKTPAELSRSSSTILGTKYLRDPQVTVTVAASVSQKVSIQGEVSGARRLSAHRPHDAAGRHLDGQGRNEVATPQAGRRVQDFNGQRMGARVRCRKHSPRPGRRPDDPGQ